MATEINYLALTNFTDPVPYLNRHKKSVSFVDELIGEVIADLENHNLLKQTIIVITGDHGQELNDNKLNYWGHNSNYSFFQTKVPFVLYWPGMKGGQINRLTSHYDITPTLMKYKWGCDNDFTQYSYGSDLFKDHQKNWITVSSYLDYGVLDLNNSQILTINQLGEYSVTDLNLREISKKDANQKLLLEAFKDLSRFKTR
jgi:uncharacterized protein